MKIGREQWDEVSEALLSNKVRTVFTAFGVFWGILILIVVLAAATGFRNGVMRGFSGFSTNSMFCWARSTSVPYEGMPSNRSISYHLSDIEALKALKGIKHVSPRSERQSTVVKDLTSESYSINGSFPEFIKQEPLALREGRYLNYGDINEKSKACVIGVGVADDMYKSGDSILGSSLMINNINFTVVGVYRKKNTTDENEQRKIFVPFTTFQQIYNLGDRVSWIAITGEDDTPISDIKPQVLSLLKERNKIAPSDERAIGYFDLNEAFQQVAGLFLILKIAGYFVGFLTLMGGVIGVSNIMLIVIRDRTKEIGIRRALGASPWTIKSQILLESVTLTLLAGVLGIVAASGVLYAVNYTLDRIGPESIEMFANPSVDLFTVCVALAILVVSGILAGLLPAQVAIRIKPVDALRVE